MSSAAAVAFGTPSVVRPGTGSSVCVCVEELQAVEALQLSLRYAYIAGASSVISSRCHVLHLRTRVPQVSEPGYGEAERSE